MNLENAPQLGQLEPALETFFRLAANKVHALDRDWNPADGSPVFTVKGKYAVRGWTEWTQGFQYGIQILVFDATGDEEMLRIGRENTLERMAPHVSHVGVHDHGFNNISTYGNLRRLALEGRTGDGPDLVRVYELALKVSGAVQVARWTTLRDGTGFIHSFNGPHSLFSDTARSCRSLAMAHKLGHYLMGENDARISLLERAVQHLQNTSRYNVYFGEGRDIYDVPGRVAHEGLFNTTDGRYRCPSTQQGYSPFSTWTRGLAWIILGFAEQLEFFRTLTDKELDSVGGRQRIEAMMLKTAQAAANFYIENSAEDGIPYWDTGAPGLADIRDWRKKPAQIDNESEPVDSSAAAIAAQGFLRLGRTLGAGAGDAYTAAGLKIAHTLFGQPYLSEDLDHQGLILHSVYHRPNGWDYIPEGKHVPQGESSMWGDYHAMELAVYLQRLVQGGRYLTFFA
ncbi:MAG TPA: glycosyl hydrolase [Candidatus Bathyarchaeia archaeon]|nr:glycosyl hydrolase [Candidatus Bathyarchaeia archaeon]